MGPQAPILGRHLSACTTILGCVRHISACASREIRLGGWGSEGPKGLTLGQYVECVRHHSVRKWKYVIKFEI